VSVKVFLLKDDWTDDTIDASEAPRYREMFTNPEHVLISIDPITSILVMVPCTILFLIQESSLTE